MAVVVPRRPVHPDPGPLRVDVAGRRRTAGRGRAARALDPRRRHAPLVRAARSTRSARRREFHGTTRDRGRHRRPAGVRGGGVGTLTSVWHDMLDRPEPPPHRGVLRAAVRRARGRVEAAVTVGGGSQARTARGHGRRGRARGVRAVVSASPVDTAASARASAAPSSIRRRGSSPPSATVRHLRCRSPRPPARRICGCDLPVRRTGRDRDRGRRTVTVYVGLLRGVNVGGKTKLPMADLRRFAEGCGFVDGDDARGVADGVVEQVADDPSQLVAVDRCTWAADTPSDRRDGRRHRRPHLLEDEVVEVDGAPAVVARRRRDGRATSRSSMSRCRRSISCQQARPVALRPSRPSSISRDPGRAVCAARARRRRRSAAVGG